MNNIVPRTSAVGRVKDDDWGDVDKGTRVTLSVSMGQKGSDKYKPGLFNFYKDTFPAQDKLKCVVVLYPHKTRVLYGEKTTDPARCRSDNFHQPSRYIKNPISDACSECPKSKWNDKEKPECSEVINLVVVDEKMVPFTLNFKRSQLKKVQSDLINKIKFMGKRPYQVMFDLGLKETVGAKGKSYYEYVFDNFRPVTPDEEDKYQQLFMAFKLTGEQAVADLHQEMEREKEADPVPDFNSDEEIPF